MKGIKALCLLVVALSVLALGVSSPSRADDYNYYAQWHAGFLPSGIAVDATATNLYVADTNDNRIMKFLTTGTLSGTFGSFGSGNGQFNFPKGVSVDVSSNVYVADTLNHRVQKFNSSGAFISTFGSLGSGNGQFNSPAGIGNDASGNVYVADTLNHRIQIFDTTGKFVSTFGSFGAGNGQFNSPAGVAVDSSGNIFVADTLNHRIQKFTSAGAFISTWGSFGSGNGQFNNPGGVAVDTSGNVFVADTLNYRIQKFDGNGVFLATWGSPGIAAGQFDSPLGVAVDLNGYVYVMDTKNDRVQVFEPVPQITITTPNGGEVWGAGSQVTISWRYLGNTGGNVKIDLLKSGLVDRTIASSASIGSGGTGSYLWTVPANQAAGSDYTVRITSTFDPTVTDVSDGPFTIEAPSITITSPNGGEVWIGGSQVTIRWTYTANPGNYVSIELLKSGSLNRVITSSTSIGSGGSGSYIWNVPSSQVADSDYTVRIINLANLIYSDTSDSSFSIVSPTLNVSVPGGGEVWGAGALVTLSWTYTGYPGPTVRIELYKGTKLNRTIITSIGVGSGGSGTYKWTIPKTQTPGNDYKIRVTSTTNSAFTSESPSPFTIVIPSITIDSPYGGQVFAGGDLVPIAWSYIGNPGTAVKIELMKGGIVNRRIYGNWYIGNNGVGLYLWKIPANQAMGNDYTIKITSTTNSAYTDETDGPFTINSPSIWVNTPAPGDVYQVGSQMTIAWTFSGGPGPLVKIELCQAGTTTCRTIVGSWSIIAGSAYVWTIPPAQAAGIYEVQVKSTTTTTVSGRSGVFFITPPTIAVASPNGGEVWTAGTTVPINWAYTGNPGTSVKIELLQGGVSVRTIASSAPKGTGGNGVYYWAIPTTLTPGSNYRMKITSTSSPLISDQSDGDFTIN
jgi:sugar lactone lactonase YvrE